MNDGAVYYGPYADVELLKEAISFMKRVFPLRSCRRLRKKICLEFHIGQCLGPCEKRALKKDYAGVVEQLKAFLEARRDDLLRSLEKDMLRFSKDKDYEKALDVKHRIEALTVLRQFHDGAAHPMFGELEELKNALGMRSLPAVVECFDISNTGGDEPVGSMVRFSGGKPDRAGYRRFRIKGVKGPDDYSMIREVVRRRYSRLAKEGKKLPDLILIDGGKGHLFSAQDEIKALGLSGMTVASIAKEFNHLYTTRERSPIRFSPGSRLLLLVQRIRDEAHRVAIEYHRRLRDKKAFDTGLRSVKGIGPVREKQLLKKFGTVENIRKASISKLKKAGISAEIAERIAHGG